MEEANTPRKDQQSRRREEEGEEEGGRKRRNSKDPKSRLMEEEGGKKRLYSPRIDPKTRLTGSLKEHELTLYPRTSADRIGRKYCRVCARKGIQNKTKYYCKSCNVALHVGNCHTLYHTKANYAV